MLPLTPHSARKPWNPWSQHTTPCPVPTPLQLLLPEATDPVPLCSPFEPPSPSPVQPTWGFGEAGVVLPEARGSLGGWTRVPTLTGAAGVFSLDGASGWVLANLSCLLEVPCNQKRMERESDPMQSPWLLREHLWKGEFLFSLQ